MRHKIESTKTVYLDGKEFVRAFFEDSEYFEDVPVENFEGWKEVTGNYETKKVMTMNEKVEYKSGKLVDKYRFTSRGNGQI